VSDESKSEEDIVKLTEMMKDYGLAAQSASAPVMN
jgi:hypothetical protein